MKESEMMLLIGKKIICLFKSLPPLVKCQRYCFIFIKVQDIVRAVLSYREMESRRAVRILSTLRFVGLLQEIYRLQSR